MFKSEKTLSVPGEYQVVFESCVQALRDAKVRVKSANPATGLISGRTYSLGISSVDRVDVQVQQGVGQCVVTMSSEFSGVAMTDYGRNARRVDRFFNALMARAAPLAEHPAALEAVQASTPTGSLPSTKYSSAPMRKQAKETSIGKVMGWVGLVMGLLFLLYIILGVLVQAPH